MNIPNNIVYNNPKLKAKQMQLYKEVRYIYI